MHLQRSVLHFNMRKRSESHKTLCMHWKRVVLHRKIAKFLRTFSSSIQSQMEDFMVKL